MPQNPSIYPGVNGNKNSRPEEGIGSTDQDLFSPQMTFKERENVIRKGGRFARLAARESMASAARETAMTRVDAHHRSSMGNRILYALPAPHSVRKEIPCLLITGKLGPYDGSEEGLLYENRVKQSCLNAFGYPPEPRRRLPAINVLLDSSGGKLDSAFRIVLYLSAYARDMDVYIPRRAKSASALIALGAAHIHLSAFGELGPLDTQINDPRYADSTVSALDCYQSVDYVRNFGFRTMKDGLDNLVSHIGDKESLPELLQKALEFSLGSVAPMLDTVKALDFGGWGRSLKIGEKYAQILLLRTGLDKDQARGISRQLVYGYTHHPFPIDCTEACSIGLPAETMEEATCREADELVAQCDDRAFVGFISEREAAAERKITRKPHRIPRRGSRPESSARLVRARTAVAIDYQTTRTETRTEKTDNE